MSFSVDKESIENEDQPKNLSELGEQKSKTGPAADFNKTQKLKNFNTNLPPLKNIKREANYGTAIGQQRSQPKLGLVSNDGYSTQRTRRSRGPRD